MSDAKVVAAMQRQAAEAEVERLRLVGELEEMRLRAAQAESMLASVSGVTRLELVAAERAKTLRLAQTFLGYLLGDGCADEHELVVYVRAAIAAAEAAP